MTQNLEDMKSEDLVVPTEYNYHFGCADHNYPIVRSNLNDKCAHDPMFCSTFVAGSTCNNNIWGCYEHGTYRNDNKCVSAVDYPCDSDTDCGDNSRCSKSICRCRFTFKTVSLTDSDG
ncbi:unnamed protein product [Didymodactylos carnosus]|uniref:EB domain-containing protein n=1 Tax=Didymodactylos carnosus TaxID=1234261 RepID=A0A8S2TNP7_9BILA|nr:unnamed protein product [Didymodactylos carnosus]CAF4299993.1 unnamed protein product [Didymodactylos carnosus]